ncbi:MAG TPA: transposase, partial [Ignavibacteriaceae bacterium]|nr:transposase [Ignavibacteriaceae bacterium]
MSSYRKLIYHIVIRTKNNHHTLDQVSADNAYAYITGIIKKMNCHMYRINGISDHIHVLTDIHPSIAPIDFIRDVKANSSGWMKKSGFFPRFTGWSDGYGIFTCSYSSL